MRKLTALLTLCLAAAFSTQAGIITVSNNSNSPGQFTDLQDAIDAAAAGDTILVAGSPTSYGNGNVYKELHIIGAGYKPNKQVPNPTTLATVTFGAQSDGLGGYNTASGSSIEGCIVGITIYGSSGYFTSNITVKRCDVTFNFYYYFHNIRIFNNVIGGVSRVSSASPNWGGVDISNNIIKSNISMIGSTGAYENDPWTVRNNIFITPNYVLSSNYNAVITNNIFYKASPYSTSNTYCVFSNNLSFDSSNNTFPVTGTNSGGNNQENVDPDFVAVSSSYFNHTHDYHLNPGSPAINAGSDGTDIGIYGGSYPWPDGGASQSGYMYAQEPQVPQVNQMNVVNAAVPLNGSINVEVRGIINH